MRILAPADYESLVDGVGGDPFESGKPFPRYSGRGMYGSSCFGWVSQQFPYRVLVELAKIDVVQNLSVSSLEFMGFEDSVYELAAAMDSIGNPRSDSMGRSTVWYWPGVAVDEAVKDEDDEDDR